MNYVPRPKLQRKIKEQLHDVREDNAEETLRLVVYGLGGSGSWCLTTFESAGKTMRRCFGSRPDRKSRSSGTMSRYIGYCSGAESIKLEDAVPMVKNWFLSVTGGVG